MAVRASGSKLGEAGRPASLAHSAPIYVAIQNAPGLADHPRAKALARAWLARLGEFEGRLYSQIQFLGLAGWNDDVSGEHLVKNRPALLQAIQAAKKIYLERTR